MNSNCPVSEREGKEIDDNRLSEPGEEPRTQFHSEHSDSQGQEVSTLRKISLTFYNFLIFFFFF